LGESFAILNPNSDPISNCLPSHTNLIYDTDNIIENDRNTNPNPSSNPNPNFKSNPNPNPLTQKKTPLLLGGSSQNENFFIVAKRSLATGPVSVVKATGRSAYRFLLLLQRALRQV
jgi:hypothetical protein